MEQLRAAIEEANARLAQIDTELEAIGQDLDPLDAKAATTAVVKRGKLVQEREALALRLPVLEQALRDAEREAATTRVTAIAEETADLVAEGERETKRFTEALAGLTALIDEAGRRRRECAALADEARYLASLHDLDAPRFPRLPTPNVADLETVAREAKDLLTADTGNVWTLTLTALQRQRERAQRERERQQSERPAVTYGEGHLTDAAALARGQEAKEKALGLDKLRTWDQRPRFRRGSYMQELLDDSQK